MTDPSCRSGSPTRVLFVCLGNICRSPLAEGIFIHLCREAGVESWFDVDSAGTGSWHVGDPPDPRALDIASRQGIKLHGTARSVRPKDFLEFDLMLAMDQDNLRNLEKGRERWDGSTRIALLRDFDPESNGELDVPDPYYGGPAGFDHVFDLVLRSCSSLLSDLQARKLRSRHGPPSPRSDDP